VSEAPLLFCVGAAKAGTSWLHRVLSDHPGCALRSIKELHFFDALDRGEVDRQVAAVTARRATYLAEMEGAGPHRLATRARQVKDCDDWLSVLKGGEDRRAYLRYLGAGAEGRMVADMTPAYALLSEERLRGMAGIAPDVRFLYLVRDPVERLWSHVRMIAKGRAEKDGNHEGRAEHVLSRVFRGKESEIAVRGDYAAAIGKLARAVDPRRLMVAVTEEMFTAPGLARIMAFLGLSAPEADFSRRIHEGSAGTLGPEARAEARAWLAAQYDFMADWLGRRPSGWAYDLQGA
jgi:hypothetical protein